MPIDYDQLMAMSVDDEPCQYSDRTAMLYALTTGFGADPLDRKELDYVYEGRALSTVPTLASMLLSAAFLENCGWDFRRVLHGDEAIELYRPLPPAARLLANRRVVAVQDRGQGKGALIRIRSDVRQARDNTVLFSATSTLMARGDGGFGGPSDSINQPQPLPNRRPDLSCDLPTRPDQALHFRLLGDRNPLHADPGLARRLGYRAPILHGRCTQGIACRAILKTICDYDFTLISGFETRFSTPVYPGDTIRTEMWQDGNVVSFRCVVPDRNVVVIDNGKCTLAG